MRNTILLLVCLTLVGCATPPTYEQRYLLLYKELPSEFIGSEEDVRMRGTCATQECIREYCGQVEKILLARYRSTLVPKGTLDGPTPKTEYDAIRQLKGVEEKLRNNWVYQRANRIEPGY